MLMLIIIVNKNKFSCYTIFRLIQSAWPDVGDPVITKEGVGIALTDLTPPHVCVCPKTGP